MQHFRGKFWSRYAICVLSASVATVLYNICLFFQSGGEGKKRIRMTGCNSGEHQKWDRTPSEGLKHRQTGLCLEPAEVRATHLLELRPIWKSWVLIILGVVKFCSTWSGSFKTFSYKRLREGLKVDLVLNPELDCSTCFRARAISFERKKEMNLKLVNIFFAV